MFPHITPGQTCQSDRRHILIVLAVLEMSRFTNKLCGIRRSVEAHDVYSKELVVGRGFLWNTL